MMMNSTRRKALALSLFTVGYNVAEGVIAIVASTLSGSTALMGLDSTASWSRFQVW